MYIYTYAENARLGDDAVGTGGAGVGEVLGRQDYEGAEAAVPETAGAGAAAGDQGTDVREGENGDFCE